MIFSRQRRGSHDRRNENDEATNILKGENSMAKCDEGYRCSVCGEDVENIMDSDLYLRYVIGVLDPELLHATPERHIRCNPVLAQFIVADDFDPILLDNEFSKSQLDPDYVREREELVSRGWQRLKQIRAQNETSILEFPLPEVRQRMKEA